MLLFAKAAGPIRSTSASASETNSKGKTYSGRGGYTGKPGFISDIQMGLGMVPKDQYYYARTAATKARRAASNRPDYGDDDNSTPAPRKPTEAELRAQRKAAALAERRRLGQIARKKFEKEKGERVAALRKKIATLLNVS